MIELQRYQILLNHIHEYQQQADFPHHAFCIKCLVLNNEGSIFPVLYIRWFQSTCSCLFSVFRSCF